MPSDHIKTTAEAAKIYKKLQTVFSKADVGNENATKKLQQYAYDIFNTIVMSVHNSYEFFPVYCDIIKLIQPHFVLDARRINNIKFLISTNIKNKLFKEALSILDLIDLNQQPDASTLRSISEIYTKYFVHLIAHGNLSPDDKTKIFQILSDVLTLAMQLDESLFIELNSAIINDEHYQRHVFHPNMNEAAVLFTKYIKSIQTIQNLKNIEEFYANSTHVMISVIKHMDTDSTAYSRAYLKNLMLIPALKENKKYNYLLCWYYSIHKICHLPNVKNFNSLLKESLESLQKLIQHTEKEQIWQKDLIVSCAKIFEWVVSRKGLADAMDQANFGLLFKILEQMLRMSDNVVYNKTVWKCCTSLRKHVVFAIAQDMIALFELALQVNKQTIEMCTSLCIALKHTTKVAEIFQCPQLKIEVQRLVQSMTKILRCESSADQSKMIIKIFDSLCPIKHLNDFIDVYHQIMNFMQLHRKAESLADNAIWYAIIVSHMIRLNKDISSIQRYALEYYTLEKNQCILEKLSKSSSRYKLEEFDKRKLMQIEIDICGKAHHNSTIIVSLLKYAETNLEFALITREQSLECTQIVNLVMEKYQTMKQRNTKAEDYLAFGYLCKILCIHRADKVRGIMSMPTKFSEDTLATTVDIEKLKLMDISAELKTIKLAVMSCEAFGKFFEVSTKPLKTPIDWQSILDDLSMLARILHYRGYVDISYSAWKLLFNIATMIDDILNQLRAMAFFCDNYYFIRDFDRDFDFNAELEKRYVSILNLLNDIKFLTPRRQNYVLTCIINIGYYYFAIGQNEMCLSLLELVNATITDLSERDHKFEVIRASYHAVHFRIMSKCSQSTISPFCYAYQIFDQLDSMAYFTSEDAINMPIVLFGIIIDIVNFESVRLCATDCVPYIVLLLKMALEYGCAYRTIQVLNLWSSLNLQTEDVTKCQIKKNLIDIIIGKRKSLDPVSVVKLLDTKCPTSAFLPQSAMMEVEPIRRSAKPMVEIKRNGTTPEVSQTLEYYILNHHESCDCLLCMNTFVKWQLFQVELNQARTFYLTEQYESLDIFYKTALRWWKRKHAAHITTYFSEIAFCFFIHFMNILRRKKLSKSVVDLNKLASTFYDGKSKLFDIAYLQNVISQTECLSLN